MERTLRAEPAQYEPTMCRPLRIGFDGGCLSNRRGFGRFARELFNTLSHEQSPHRLIALVDEPSLASGAAQVPGGFDLIPVPVRRAPSQAASSDGSRSVADLLAMSRAASRAQLDVLYFPATYTYFPVRKLPQVVTVFDTMALDHPRLIFPNWRGRLAWTAKELLAVRSARHVLTVSESSRRAIERWFRLPESRVSVVPCAPSAVFEHQPEGPSSRAALARYGLLEGERFFLYVGGLSPHKNLLRLIEAFSRLHEKDTRLVLVGDLGDVFHTHVPELRKSVSDHALEGRVLFPGFVPDGDLTYLYSRAAALVQPSLIEGFGLPPVEAMACGTPVLASTAGSLPEVVGDAGRFFDPLSIWSIATELSLILHDAEERERLAERAVERARLFQWSATARGVLAACERVGYQSLEAKSPGRAHHTRARRAETASKPAR